MSSADHSGVLRWLSQHCSQAIRSSFAAAAAAAARGLLPAARTEYAIHTATARANSKTPSNRLLQTPRGRETERPSLGSTCLIQHRWSTHRTNFLSPFLFPPHLAFGRYTEHLPVEQTQSLLQVKEPHLPLTKTSCENSEVTLPMIKWNSSSNLQSRNARWLVPPARRCTPLSEAPEVTACSPGSVCWHTQRAPRSRLPSPRSEVFYRSETYGSVRTHL